MIESEQITDDYSGQDGRPDVIATKDTIVMVGLMGAGKTAIGRRLAGRLELPFVDADDEIAAAAGSSINDIFERLGEASFRDGERRVIARLLDGPAIVLATGGGAFMDAQTRERIAAKGVSVWLRTDIDTLVRRTSRREDRPLLKNGDPREILLHLMEQRYPIYQLADIVVDSLDAPAEDTLQQVLNALEAYRAAEKA
jgi:shikimate kinase